ncbi:hypothetical protein PNOK_0890100 [Pyrrhoderma noxium]|uniref:Uncharacterized protein n=1 Tax=Pyrrhoderma noxium TaxID=2282107 RepID=A0A286U6F2_9AGAM|nr:hypothetical protein PNOK_0890100 [Pyrrhoderma noxium]
MHLQGAARRRLQVARYRVGEYRIVAVSPLKNVLPFSVNAVARDFRVCLVSFSAAGLGFYILFRGGDRRWGRDEEERLNSDES